MIDEKARARAVEVAKEMVADRANHWEIADAVIEAYGSAKPKEAEGLKLGSRLTVEGVEAVVVDAAKLKRAMSAAALCCAQADACAVNHYGDDYHVHGEPAWLTDARADIVAFRAMLSAAGDANG